MMRALVIVLCCNGCAIALGAGVEWQPRRPEPRTAEEPGRLNEFYPTDSYAKPLPPRRNSTGTNADGEIHYSVTPLTDHELPRSSSRRVAVQRGPESSALSRSAVRRADRLRRLEEYEQDIRHTAFQEVTVAPQSSGVPVVQEEVSAAPLLIAPEPYEPVYESQAFGVQPNGVFLNPSYGSGYGNAPGACGPPHRFWIRGEWLLWWAKGMDTPPLVTTSPLDTDGTEAGVLGFEDTEILFGDEALFDGARHGARFRAGVWLDSLRHLGLEGEYFTLAEESLNRSWSSDAEGEPILARPFFNMNPRDPDTLDFDGPARQDSELVAYPDLLAGSVAVHADTWLQSAGLRLRNNLCCSNRCCQDPCTCNSSYCGGWRLDFLLGYRYLYLKERLTISEELLSLDDENPGMWDIRDDFGTKNSFHGGDIGVLWESQWNRWSLEGLLKIGLGFNHQVVNINGDTVYTAFEGAPENAYDGGLLALRSNSGNHTRDVFCVVPELGVTVGYQITQNVKATVGYSFVYISRVVRPGDQIDLDVNPDLLPEELDPVEGALRPQFAFVDDDYWLHGLNVGLECRF